MKRLELTVIDPCQLIVHGLRSGVSENQLRQHLVDHGVISAHGSESKHTIDADVRVEEGLEIGEHIGCISFANEELAASALAKGYDAMRTGAWHTSGVEWQGTRLSLRVPDQQDFDEVARDMERLAAFAAEQPSDRVTSRASWPKLSWKS